MGLMNNKKGETRFSTVFDANFLLTVAGMLVITSFLLQAIFGTLVSWGFSRADISPRNIAILFLVGVVSTLSLYLVRYGLAVATNRAYPKKTLALGWLMVGICVLVIILLMTGTFASYGLTIMP